MKIEFVASQPMRLDRFVERELPFVRRALLQKQFRNKEIKINGRVGKPELKILFGDNVVVFLPNPHHNFALLTGCEILYEDANVIAFNKRAGITTVPGVGTRGDTLIDSAEKLLNLKLIAVHRLDRDTSGIIMFAKHAQIARRLEEEFRKRRTRKIYYAIVVGNVKQKSGVINFSLREYSEKMIIDSKGQFAETFWRVIKQIGVNTLLEIIPVTGRKHQIRAHLAAIGYPIVNDKIYGIMFPNHQKKQCYQRHLLHAHRLEILHYKITAKLPSEFNLTF